MKIGDLVRMKTPLTPERCGMGIIQEIVNLNQMRGTGAAGYEVIREAYHVRWNDNRVSIQYDDEIILVSKA